MSKRRNNKPTQAVSAEITALSHEGRGIAQVNGKATFIRGALPGESVTFTYLKTHRKYDEGIAESILKPSENRVTPNCEHFGVCGGCNLQHLSHEAQIQHKQSVLLQQLEHIGQIKMPAEKLLPPLTGDTWGYRHKARLGVKYVRAKEKVLVGFREINGRFLADLNHCPVLHPAVGEKIHLLKTLIETLSIYEQIPQIEVAVGEANEVALVIRHLTPFSEEDIQKLLQFAENYSGGHATLCPPYKDNGCIKLYLQPGNASTIHRIFPKEGDDFLHYYLPEQNVKLRFEPSDFTQVNPSINRQMIGVAIKLLDLSPNDRVLDLFCGLGNFTLPIAKNCREVIGVEGSADLVKRATLNAEYNDISNAQFYAADLTQDITQHPWAKQAFDKILLDPPRTGAFEVLPLVTSLNPKRIVYVSCNPATLARDAGELAQKGYILTNVGIMDMFPHTAHVESIGVFEKSK